MAGLIVDPTISIVHSSLVCVSCVSCRWSCRACRVSCAAANFSVQIGEDEERVLRLKGGIVVRKRDSASEWDLLALPEGAIMLLDREPSGLNSSTVSLGDQVPRYHASASCRVSCVSF